MLVKDGTVIMPDHPVTREPMKVAEKLYKMHGVEEGITITAGKDGIHSAGSWHYVGAAFDIRIWAFDKDQVETLHHQMVSQLKDYDVLMHKSAKSKNGYSHIHIEPKDHLAKQWGLML